MKTMFTLKLALLAALAALAVKTAQAQTITNLGAITMKHALGWDYDTNVPLEGFRVYVGPTNWQAAFTNSSLVVTGFIRIPSATGSSAITTRTNYWPGENTRFLGGPRYVYVTALSTDGLEGDRSDIFLLNFKAGVPMPPTRFHLFTVMTLLATNSLQPVVGPQ